jgi:hypothetical protein
MGGYPQHLVTIHTDDGSIIQMLLSRYTVSGIASMYCMARSDVVECATDIEWLRRAVFRLRDHAYHMANGTMPRIPYPTLHERENALFGLVFVPE